MPILAGRTAVALVAACWLAAPSGAWAQESPGLDVSGLTNAATGAVAATGSAVESTVTTVAPLTGPAEQAVTQVAGTVGRVTGPEGPVARVTTGASGAAESVVEQVTKTAAPVAGVADRVVREAQPSVDKTLQGAAGAARAAVADDEPASAAAGQGSPRVERLSGGRATGAETPRASGMRLRGTAAPERPETALPGPRGDAPRAPAFSPLIPIGVPAAPAGGGDASSTGTSSGALQPPAQPEPSSGPAGGSAGGASVSFSLGGLALLLAAFSLAGPALRRRLPRRPVIAWPAAFVPLLERPG
jgi:hypothetical protein